MNQRGFSLIETMIVLVIVLVISGAIFQVINLATQRSSTEQSKVDMFQEAREFMDQMSRDLRQAGYPNARNFTTGILTGTVANSAGVAVGLVNVDTGDLWFEGDVDGTGAVSSVRYHLESTGTNCPCLQRSQVTKAAGDPLTGQSTNYQVEVQGVQNSDIFSGRSDGSTVGLPVAFTSSTAAAIDTIQAVLTLQSPVIDPQTRTRPVTTLVTTVKLNNCSLAATGRTMSCY